MNRTRVIAAVCLRDGPSCYICGQGGDPRDPWEVEHVRPRAHGGTDDLANLALAHASCNRTKGVQTVIKRRP